MPYFPELAERDKVHHGLTKFNTGMERPLLDLQHEIMRSAESPLTVAQRELIAAFVSAINGCAYCRGAHTATAVAFGIRGGLVEELLEGIENADIEAEFKPILKFVHKLTSDLASMNQSDADAVFEAGWSSRALYDAIAVCGVFNFMSRYVNGLGLEAYPEDFPREGRMLKRGGYAVSDLLRLR